MVDSSPPPPPLDDPSVSSPLECPPLKWGMLGCGRVSHDFTQALKHLSTASVVACSTSSDLDRAVAFSKKHGIDKAYGSYEELVKDEAVEIVYVGNVHCFRRSVVELCIRANKHVLVEKPFACTLADAEYLLQLAKEHDVFIMEGLWTRFFPAVEQARLLVQQGVIGEVISVFSDFNFCASDSEAYPDSFVYQRKLGGGATLLTGPYPVQAATLFFQGKPKVQATGQVDAATGVDLQAAMILTFEPTGTVPPALDPSTKDNTPKLPGAGIACLSYGMLGESGETTTVNGTKGRFTIETPCHCPTKLVVTAKDAGRGNVTTTVYDYPLPADTDDITTAGGYFYPNSAGFCYEAAAVARCIAAGKKEVAQYTLQETLIGMEIIEQARLQLGVKAVQED
jgi:dihydrodiol dehydrogenase / D-xylose 1-dehydrogenase (NADP)